MKEECANTINLSDKDIKELVEITKGYSGADLKGLFTEAAMIPLRSIEDIVNLDLENIRPLVLDDFKQALNNVKATVNERDLDKYLKWNELNGCYPIKEEDLKD